MAVTKYKVIKNNLQAVINYAKNGDKTENGILVSAINCLEDKAYEQMNLTKKAFHKENGRQGYHFIQSFNGNEVSPQKANRIGLELAENLWGDKYQVLVCTHTNKENIHNHIILNSVSFIDGSKYHNSNVELALLRETSDELCIKYDLSVIKSNKSNKETEIARNRIANYNRNSGKMEIIKAEIDEAIKVAKKYSEFEQILQFKGYYIKKTSRYFTIKTPYYNRNIRLSRAFGEDYTFDNIKTRIYHNGLYNYLKERDGQKVYAVKIYEGVKIDPVKLKTSSFYRLYVHYLYVLGKLPPKVHYEYRTKQYYKELDKFNRICDEIRMISKYDFNTTKYVQAQQTQLLEKVAPLKSKREDLWREYNKTLI